MQQCQQTEEQSVWQHGLSVKKHIFELINYLKTQQISNDWKLPEWILQYRLQILQQLVPEDIIAEYTTYHDCGKPYCIQYDANGKRHFPNHAEFSYKKWLEVGGTEDAAILMKMDMDIHLLKSDGVEEFCKRSQAITLLLTGLSEIISNSKMFGGFDSISFKIKYKHIDKMGKRICKKIFDI